MRRERAVVTGSAGGVGSAIVSQLSKRCETILAIDRASLGNDVHTLNGCTLIQWRADINSASIWDRIDRALEYANLVVHCTGLNRVAKFGEVKATDWDNVFNANLRGPFFTTQGCLGALRRSPGDLPKRVVFLVSIAAQVPHTLSSAYNASKAGLRMVIKQLGRELAPEGIIVSGVSPCIIEGTGMTEDVFRQLAEIRGEPVGELEKNYLHRVPGGRYVTVDEVVNAVLWLLGPESSFCIGADLEVAGGML